MHNTCAWYPRCTILVPGINGTHIFMSGIHDTQYLCLVSMIHNIYVRIMFLISCSEQPIPLMFPLSNYGEKVTVTSRNLWPACNVCGNSHFSEGRCAPHHGCGWVRGEFVGWGGSHREPPGQWEGGGGVAESHTAPVLAHRDYGDLTETG